MVTTVARDVVGFGNGGGGHRRAPSARRVYAADGGNERARAMGAWRWSTYRDVLLRFAFDNICERLWIPEARVASAAPLDASDKSIFMIFCIHIYVNVNRFYDTLSVHGSPYIF